MLRVLHNLAFPRKLLAQTELLQNVRKFASEPAAEIDNSKVEPILPMESDDNESVSNSIIPIEDFKEYIKCDEDEEKCRRIILEIYSMKCELGFAPSKVPAERMAELMDLTSKYARRKFYVYLFKREMSIQNDAEKKKIKRIAREERFAQKQSPFEKNSIFPFIRDATQNRQHNYKLQAAAQFGSKVVFDCSFSGAMKMRELRSCAEQIQGCFRENRRFKEPLDLTLAEFPEDGPLRKMVEFSLPEGTEKYLMDRVPTPITELFPGEKIIYLTPDSRNILKTFDHNAVYVIGALVDLGGDQPHTLSKATRIGIKNARFPTKEYLSCLYRKSFNLMEVMNALNYLKEGYTWEQIFGKILPKRMLERSVVNQPIQRKPPRLTFQTPPNSKVYNHSSRRM